MPEDKRIMDRLGKPLDFNAVFFLQLNRILRAMSMGDGSHTNAIEGLECILYPYLDKRYEKQIEKLSKQVVEKKKQLARIKGKSIERLDDADVEALVFNLTKSKFNLLMEVALRNRLIPEQEEDYYET